MSRRYCPVPSDWFRGGGGGGDGVLTPSESPVEAEFFRREADEIVSCGVFFM